MARGEPANTPLRLLFAGGGTGGHLYPAIAIADAVRQKVPDAAITFVGTRNTIESRVVPAHGYAFRSIWISGFKRKLSLDLPVFFLKIVVALVQSYMLIKRLKPQVVVGTGGYVCGPPLYVASLLNIPTLIQEQNSFPGVTTRMLAPRVKEVHISFSNARKHLQRADNVYLTGNPTRAGIGDAARGAAAEYFGIDPAKQTLLVVGGSQGAASINNAMLKIVREILAADIQVVWVTGDADFPRVEASIRALGASSVKLTRYLERMEFGFAVADLAVCRSGATTIAELTSAGIPSVMIPYPLAAADHQTENARAVAGSGACVIIRDRDLDSDLLPTLRELFGNPARLKDMGAKARAIGAPDATGILAAAVLRLAGKSNG